MMLSIAEIDEVWLAAVGLRLGGSRAALLAPLHPIARERLNNCQNNADQLYSDLVMLNEMGRLRDGSVPLADWLDTAYTLTGCHTGAELFHRYRARLRATPLVPPRLRRTIFGRRPLAARGTGLLVALAVLAAAGVAMGVIGTGSAPRQSEDPAADEPPRPAATPSGSQARPRREPPPRLPSSVEGEGCVAQWASGILAGTPSDYRYPLLCRELDAPYLKGFELYETGTGAGRIVYGVAPTRALVDAARAHVAEKGRATYRADCRPGLANSIRRTGRHIPR